MILVILGVFTILLVIGFFEDFEGLIGISIVILIGSVIATGVLCYEVSTLRVIDQKIEMYEAENAKIETQIAECVESYMSYESDTFKAISDENVMALITLYPELKSDSLVQKQIEVYTSNNEKIRSLKADKIDGSVNRWWLYFGG